MADTDVTSDGLVGASHLPPLKFIRKEESPLDMDTTEPMTPTGLQFRSLVYDDIVSVFLFNERVKLEDIRASVKETVCKHPRFHSNVPEPSKPGDYKWVPMDEVDVNWHVIEEPEELEEDEESSVYDDGEPGEERTASNGSTTGADIPPPKGPSSVGCSLATQRTIERYEALLMDDKRPRLSFDRPPWRVYLVHVKRRHVAEGQSREYTFIVFRINHAIGDLSCLMALFKDMTTPVPSKPTSAEGSATSAADPATSSGNNQVAVPSSSPATAKQPSWLLSTAIYVMNTIRGLIDFLLMTVLRESHTCFINQGRVLKWGEAKDGSHLPTAVAFTQAMDLTEVNRLRNKLNATVNDFMTACLAGGMERYLQETGQWDGKKRLRIRAGCPVNLREKFNNILNPPEWWSSYDGPGSSLAGPWGTNTGYIFVKMPIFKDPGRENASAEGSGASGKGNSREARRVVAVKKQMDCIKNSFDPVILRASPDFCGIPVPQSITVGLNNAVNNLFSIAISNIQGPRQRIAWAGYEVVDFFTQSYGPIHMAVMFQIYSYNGIVRVGVVSNKFFIQKPRLLCKCIHDAFLQLRKDLDSADGQM